MESVVHHVAVERDRAQIFETGGLIEVDGVARLVDVEDFSVRARSNRHARAAVELDLAFAAPPADIDRPELVVEGVLYEDVGLLSTGRQRGSG